MTGNFNTYIDHIDPEFWRELCVSHGKLFHYNRGEEFLHIGEAGKYIGMVKSGTLKYVTYSAAGTEHVVGLIFPNEFVVDWPFVLYEQPSRVAIIASSQCTIYCLPVEVARQRMKEEPEFMERMMHCTEAVFSTVYDRYIDLYRKTPQQRYTELVEKHPDLFTHFSLHDIASFLNITPTHLSRLRKNCGNL